MTIPNTASWPFIKVCGIQTPDEGVMALSCGANTIGLLVGLTHKAEDEVSIETARTIRAATAKHFPRARIVMVTHLLNPERVYEIATLIGVNAIQIHDNMNAGDFGRLRSMLPQIELFKAVHIEGNGKHAERELIAYAQAYDEFADGFLTDSKSVDPDGQLRIGGTGKRHSLSMGRALIEAFPHKPVILAGGLNGVNVAKVIEEIMPAGIDANSGLENPDGSKSPDKIRQFALAGQLCPQMQKRFSRQINNNFMKFQ